jgi:hypothetical protein
MEIREMITKFRMTLAEKDGQEGIRVYGKPTTKQVEEIKAKKAEIIAELHRIEDEEKAKAAAEKARKEAEKQGILNSSIKIKVEYHDGEYLSGYEVYGQAGELLEEIGAAKYIEGWGYRVDFELVEALGKEFTYAKAMEYTRPAREAKAAKEQAEKAEKQAKFDEAKTTGKPVELKRYTAECNDPQEECNMDIVTVYAMPDGSTKTVRMHTW